MRYQHGVGLFEVLLTSVICTIGLVSLMKMQWLSMKNAHLSQRHFYIVFHSAQMLDLIKSNRLAISTYVGVFPQQNSRPSCLKSCSAQTIAMQDIYDFKHQLHKYLPDPEVTITHESLYGLQDVYRLSVRWQEENLATANESQLSRHYQQWLLL